MISTNQQAQAGPQIFQPNFQMNYQMNDFRPPLNYSNTPQMIGIMPPPAINTFFGEKRGEMQFLNHPPYPTSYYPNMAHHFGLKEFLTTSSNLLGPRRK